MGREREGEREKREKRKKLARGEGKEEGGKRRS